MVMADRLAMDAHFHGHDGALLLAGYSFAEITTALFKRCKREKLPSRIASTSMLSSDAKRLNAACAKHLAGGGLGEPCGIPPVRGFGGRRAPKPDP